MFVSIVIRYFLFVRSFLSFRFVIFVHFFLFSSHLISSSSHISSHSLLLNLTNNLILYQTIFDPLFSNKNKNIFKQFNKTKYRLSTNEYKINKTFSQHGLLIDKYLDNEKIDENLMNDSFPWKYFLQFLFISFLIVLIYYNRDCLFKRFRERHKRSVLKYSV